MAPSVSVKLFDAKHSDAGSHDIKNADEAFEFLKKAARQKGNMTHFAQLWEQLRPKRLGNRTQKDREVLKGLADLIASGQLRTKAKHGGGGGSNAEDGPMASNQPLSREQKQTFAGSGLKIRMSPEKIIATVAAPIDVAQQVDALKAAALSGIPFVEQCR